MKTITFFNEKGGVGKSTLTIMYASWLKYKHGVSVAVVDYNRRLEQYRRDEWSRRSELGLGERISLDNAWPIITADTAAIRKLERDKISLSPNAFWFENLIRSGKCDGYDILLLDFPGSYSEFSQLMVHNMISLYCVVLDRDPQTARSTVQVVKGFKDVGGRNALGIINQAQHFVSMKEYNNVKNVLENYGLPMLPDMVSYSERMKKISEPDIMRSSLEYPDWDAEAFAGSGDLGTENLFIDVTRELQKAADFKGTATADLSFVETLTKKLEGQDKRQLTGTAFPQYEFPIEAFPASRRRQMEALEK